MVARHGTELHWGHVTFFSPRQRMYDLLGKLCLRGTWQLSASPGTGTGDKDWGLLLGIRIGIRDCVVLLEEWDCRS